MTSIPVVSTRRSDDPSLAQEELGTEPQASSLAQTIERNIAPIQAPLPAGTPVREQLTGGFTATPNSANATFAVLKATVLQQTFGHPLAYARVLMQLGYEPLAAYRGKTLFGKEAVFYPNIFRYLKYIYQVDGLTGLYRGYGCALASKMVCWYATTKVDELLGPVEAVVPSEHSKPTWNKCIKKTLREVRCQSWGILISHPFQVMAVRCMSQFIGRETSYSSLNIFQNFQEIYAREGLGGFFVGLIPRWLLETATIVISNVLIHLLKSQLPSQSEVVPLYEYMAALLAQTATYPLSVLGTVMAVNRSGLRAGVPPLTPIYTSWQEAYRHLGTGDQLKRGSSLFNRVVLGTTTVLNPKA